jgi:hypothetical protein
MQITGSLPAAAVPKHNLPCRWQYAYCHSKQSSKNVIPIKKSEAMEAVREIWGPDPVHPSLDCMDKLAAKLITILNGEEKAAETASTTSTTAAVPPSKRLKWASDTPSPFVTTKSSVGRGASHRGWGRNRGRGFGKGRGSGGFRGRRGFRGGRY